MGASMGGATFASLLAFCRACGSPAAGEACSACTVSLEPSRRPGSLGAIGGWLIHQTSQAGAVVIGGSETRYTVMTPAGELDEVDARHVGDFSHPIRSGGWTYAGALLAASQTYTDLEPGGVERLHVLARSWATSAADRRGLLLDALKLGLFDIAAAVAHTPTELTWALACTLTQVGAWAPAIRAALRLPSPGYAARLILLMRASEHITLHDHDPELGDTLDALAQVGGITTLAVEVLRSNAALTSGQGVRRAVDDALPELGLGGVTPLVTLASNVSSRAARLIHLATSHERGVPLDDLGDAPRAIIDALVDTDRLDTTTLGRASGLNPYLVARLAPNKLGDAQLRELGAEAELRRRGLNRGSSTTGPASTDVSQVWKAGTHMSASAEQQIEAIALLRPALADAIRVAAATDSPPDDDLMEGSSALTAAAAVLHRSNATLPLQPDRDGPHGDLLGLVALRRAKEALHAHDLATAKGHAAAALRNAVDERVRDEALNILACVHWLEGQDHEALKALQTAMKGAYTESLQANIAVVAAELDPVEAASHLSRLVIDAPALPLRIAAARRAIHVWQLSHHAFENDGDLPRNLAQSLRQLLVEDIDEATYVDVLRLLAINDPEWLAGADLTTSPHRHRPETIVYQARARGFADFIPALAQALRTPGVPDRLVRERDELIAAVADRLMAGEPDGAWVWLGDLILEADLPLDGFNGVMVRAGVVRGATLGIEDWSEAEPAHRYLDVLDDALIEARCLWDQQRTIAEDVVQRTFGLLATAHTFYRLAIARQAASLHDSTLEHLQYSPAWQLDYASVVENRNLILDFCAITFALIGRLRPHVPDDFWETFSQLEHLTEMLQTSASSLLD